MNSCILELNLNSSGQPSFDMFLISLVSTYCFFWKTTAGHACTDAAAQNAYKNFLERNQIMCYWMWSGQMNLGCNRFLTSHINFDLASCVIHHSQLPLFWRFKHVKSFNCTFCNPAMTSHTNHRIANSCINQVESALTPSFVHAWRAISGTWAKFSSFYAAHHSTVMLAMSWARASS